MGDPAFLLEPQLKQTGCLRDPFPQSLHVTIAPVNMVKASARQKAGSQHLEGLDKTVCLHSKLRQSPWISSCSQRKDLYEISKPFQKKKKTQIPQMLGYGPFFHVMYRNFSKTGWGIVSEKGKTFQTACFQKPSEPCGGGRGQIFCWSPSGITSRRTQSARKEQIWSFAAPVQFLPSQAAAGGTSGSSLSSATSLGGSLSCAPISTVWITAVSASKRKKLLTVSVLFSPE